ncbi:MAG: hypothetical protein AB8B60_00955 [Sulfitobacter sp.]
MTDTDPNRQKVIDDLLALVRASVTDELMQVIAEGDNYASPEEDKTHRTAIQTLCDTYDWHLAKMPESDWYPSEPIELISYAASDDPKTAIIICNALLMVAELEGLGRDFMHFRWFDSPGEAWFRDLDEPWLAAFLAAFKIHHAETQDWFRRFIDRKEQNGTWIEAGDD